MGRRKKTLLCLLLWYALVYAECVHTTAAAQPLKFYQPLPLASRKLSKAYRESENYETPVATGLSNGETKHYHSKLHKSLPIVVPDEIDSKSRIGYEKDIMLVLPVKPNTNDSDLQMWYTQKPITAIVDDQGVSRPEHRADYDVYEDTKLVEDRHPYTNFLVKKMSSKPQKSPLDYGYPESFKFVEDLNGLPSNHKPEWASTDVTDLTSSSSTTQLTTASVSSTRNNPFEMFESVRPLDINKFLSPSMIASMPESDETTTEVKNVTESHIHSIPKRPAKQPIKKPQKTKLTTEATTTEFTLPDVSSHSSQVVPIDPEQVYTAVRYTTLLKQTNKEFLPMFSHKPKPTSQPGPNYQTFPPTTTTTEAVTTPRTTPTTPRTTPTTPRTTPTTPRTTSTTTTEPTTTTTRKSTSFSTTSLKRIIVTTPPTTTTTTTTPRAISTTTTTTTAAPTSLNDIAVYNVTEDVDDDPLLSESFDNIQSQNLSDFQVQINHFEPPKDVDFFKPDTPSTEPEPFKDLNPNIPGDMLTNDMKNMLIALGIIKSDQITTTSTTEKVIIRKEPVTPNYDSDSYTSFKKIPIDNKQPDKTGISDDMKDLLASFGLIPKKKLENETFGNRISRQQNLTVVDDLDIPASFNFTESETKLAPVFVSNSSQVRDDFESDVAEFFDNDKPIAENQVSSDKPMTLNSEMFPDDMKNTLETLGFLKQPSLHNRSPKSAHVFQPTSQLEKLNQDDASKKITDVLKTIKSLSVKTETNNITAEELEKQLETITNTLESDSFNEVNDTLLLDILSNDTNLKLIESIDNMTSKFRPANKTWTVAAEATTTIKIPPKLKPSSTTTEKVIQTIRPSDLTKLQPEMKPPNPLSTDELLQLYEMGKNEIKRQQPNLTSSSETPDVGSTTITSSIDDTSIPGANTEIFSTNTDQPNVLETSSSSTTSSSTTSTESTNDAKGSANNNAPISALVDSFGGGGVASEEPTADDLPTPKPNGLYFYVDWNTFLNVGEDDKRPIRIRFAPRAGNARNFIPITVP